MNGSPFRAEALEHHATGTENGELLRYEPRWTRLVYTLLKVAAVVGFTFVSLFSVDEYAAGPAVVRVDGRRMISASSSAIVHDVLVTAGQVVKAGTVLVKMQNTEEAKELARATSEFDLQLIRMLRDPSDTSVRQSLATLRAAKEQAKNTVENRTVVSQFDGVVSDVRVRAGQHVNAGEILLALAPKGRSQMSLIAIVPADYRPMLKTGLKMRFELDGFRYEYADLSVSDVSAEAVGTTEVQRLLGQEKSDAVHLDPGAKVLVSAPLPTTTFTSDGQPYGYFDGLTGLAQIRVRSEPILVTLVPALRRILPGSRGPEAGR